MLEQFIAPDHYELMKVLAATVDPVEFPQEGLVHFRLKEIAKGVFCPTPDPRVFHDDMVFMREVSSKYRFFAFVKVQNGETILGFRAPKMFGEFVRVNDKWELREYEDFHRRKKTPAEMRFEIGKDFAALKKFLS